MAKNLQVGEEVYVPCARVPDLASMGTALYKCTVTQVDGRKVKVTLPGSAESEWIGASLLHRDVGILIINGCYAAGTSVKK